MVTEPRNLSRREFSVGALCVFAASLAPGFASADGDSLAALVRVLFGRSDYESSKIKLDLPESADNGAVVPISVEVESPMTEKDHVWSLHLFAFDNPEPQIASYSFTPASGRASIATRIRLAKSQEVIAVAEMSNGKVYVAKGPINVMTGGWG